MFPVVKRITNEEQRQMTIEAAKLDNDAMHFPTHMVLRNGEIVGGWCVAGVPLVMIWNHSEKIKARDSMMLNNVLHSMMDDRNAKMFFIAANDKSPYYEHLEKLGFKPVWPTNIFYGRT